MTGEVFILFEVEKRNWIQNVAQVKNSIPLTMHTHHTKGEEAEMLIEFISGSREQVYFIVHSL